MDIKMFLSTKKPRRSNRLVEKENKHRSSNLSSDSSRFDQALTEWQLGYFDMLSIEVKFRVLSYLTVPDLSYLSICSKTMRNVIEGYRVTRFSGVHHVPYETLHEHRSVARQTMLMNIFYQQGLLMKRSTCLYATKDRLKIINEFLTRMACTNCSNCTDPSRCVALLCFGTFLHTIIAGWDDSECQRVFDSISQHMCAQRHIKTVVTSRPGSHSQQELWVRHFFRRVFLDPCATVIERAFWLTRILKPWPLVFQARLLLLLYCGQISGGELQWQEMIETTPANREQSAKYYSCLAATLLILYHHSAEWSCDEVICILDEITATPEDWLVENTAGLLLACGDNITTKILRSRAINGKFDNLASVIAALCLVCVKQQHNMSVVMRIVTSVIEIIDVKKEKMKLLVKVADTFKELILDSVEFSDSDDVNDSEFFHHLTAMTEFSKQLIDIAFRNVTEF